MKNAISMEGFFYWDLYENMTININEHEFITISGPNNCGKTTLLRILSREIITENKLEIFEKDINSYTIADYSKMVQCIIPMESYFQEKTLEEEINLYLEDKKEIDELLKGMKCKKLKKKEFSNMTDQELLISRIVVTLSQNPKLLLMDQLSIVLEEKETMDILEYLNSYRKDHDITIIYTTLNLEESLKADYLYIVSEKKINLSGKPLEVLKKDNMINKIGLKIPFMIDLSVKLIDYDLIKEVELDKNRMVNMLWK